MVYILEQVYTKLPTFSSIFNNLFTRPFLSHLRQVILLMWLELGNLNTAYGIGTAFSGVALLTSSPFHGQLSY